jgi:GNAT superfamily N-acetyltransferase
MAQLKLISAHDVDESQLICALKKFYGKAKGDFLEQHGDWWYQGKKNSLAIIHGDKIAAYCALIPNRCLLNGAETDVIWWVDLVVSPEYRGKGLQTKIDSELRNSNKLILGFPNKLAAKIHRRHGWGVSENGIDLMLPLKPVEIKSLKKIGGIKGKFVRSCLHILTPAANHFSRKLTDFEARFAYAVEAIHPDVFSQTFKNQSSKDTMTTFRDQEYFNWRYLSAPYLSELKFYLSGPIYSPTHFLIARHINKSGYKAVRILDIFGNFQSLQKIRDLIFLAVKDAIVFDASQVTIMVWIPELASIIRRAGFLFSSKARFCWHSTSKDTMQKVGESKIHLSICDSDNDEPI